MIVNFIYVMMADLIGWYCCCYKWLSQVAAEISCNRCESITLTVHWAVMGSSLLSFHLILSFRPQLNWPQLCLDWMALKRPS